MANPVCCSLLIPFNDSWTLWGPRCPLATDRVFRIVDSWSSVWCNLVCVRVVVPDIVVWTFVRVRLCQPRIHNKCFHMICCSVSFTRLHISFSFMCVILCNRVPENFNISELSSLVFRILIRSMSRVVVNSFVVQDLQTLMSPRPCYPLVTVVFF